MAEVRSLRDLALSASDREKIKLDEIGSSEERKEMAAYRQTLRDLPAVVEAELDSMPLDQLEIFKPRLPEKPKV
jgi:hypothetical protein